MCIKNKTHNSHKQFPQSDKRLWILTSLFRFAHRQFNRDINLLDYGAGSGTIGVIGRHLLSMGVDKGRVGKSHVG